MRGTDNITGKELTGIEHLRQSISDILTTPKGSRVMRRDYGSDIFSLIDRPADAALMVDLYAAVAEALDKWEPRFRLDRVQVESIDGGHVTLSLEGEYLPEGKAITLEGIRA